MSAPIIPGAEPWSHEGAGPHGVLVIHGFTGNPASMRELAEAFAAAGFHIEMPRLPGHGTAVGDMMPTRWADWAGEAEAAYQRIAARSDKVVVAGLSMGGALTLKLGAEHPEIAGLVCVNPTTMPPVPEIIQALHEMIDGGMDVMPGIGSDIADPEVTENAYPETPLAAALSLMEDGLPTLPEAYPGMTIPLLLLTAPQDHVVEPAQADYLVEHYGAPVERILLERSYHVATLDFDKQLILDAAVDFARRVTG